MSKVRERENQEQRLHTTSSQQRAGAWRKKRAMARPTSESSEITTARYPLMSDAALTFARQMQANPQVQAVMRDLADK